MVAVNMESVRWREPSSSVVFHLGSGACSGHLFAPSVLFMDLVDRLLAGLQVSGWHRTTIVGVVEGRVFDRGGLMTCSRRRQEINRTLVSMVWRQE